MSEHVDTTSTDDARAALASVERMRAAGVRRGRTPCWLRATFAVFLGAFVAVQGMTTMPGAVTPLFGVAVAFMIIFGGRDSVMARPRRDSSTLAQVVTILGFAVVVLASAMGGLALRVKLDWIWAPAALGVLVAAGAFLFTEARTRAWAARQRKGADGA